MGREFVLVHGMSHGAWAWEPLARRLETNGHHVVAMDLPGHGRRAHERGRASVETYARAAAPCSTRRRWSGRAGSATCRPATRGGGFADADDAAADPTLDGARQHAALLRDGRAVHLRALPAGRGGGAGARGPVRGAAGRHAGRHRLRPLARAVGPRRPGQDSREDSYAGRAARRRGAGAPPSEARSRTMNETELKQKTRDTARKLFHTLKGGAGYEQWKKFDKDLARQLSMFFAGALYSREVISQKQRELCAVASLTVLDRHNELRAHIQ